MKKIILAILLLLFTFPAFAQEKESAYDRVIRTGTLRCAYVSVGTLIQKDPNTGKMYGAIVDITKELADNLSLNLEWTEEVGYGSFAEGFASGRYDAFCGSIVITPPRTRISKLTVPFMGLVTKVYVRADDNRFHSLADMNKPDVKAGTIDGHVFQSLTQKILPKARQVSLPDTSASSQLFMDLTAGKTDLVIYEAVTAKEFIHANKGSMKEAFDKPIGSQLSVFAVGPKETDLKDMLDSTFLYMINSGRIDSILNRHDIERDDLYRAQPLLDAPEGKNRK